VVGEELDDRPYPVGDVASACPRTGRQRRCRRLICVDERRDLVGHLRHHRQQLRADLLPQVLDRDAEPVLRARGGLAVRRGLPADALLQQRERLLRGRGLVGLLRGPRLLDRGVLGRLLQLVLGGRDRVSEMPIRFSAPTLPL
jgi:hypothetical protein